MKLLVERPKGLETFTKTAWSAPRPGNLMNPFATPAAFTPGAEISSSAIQTRGWVRRWARKACPPSDVALIASPMHPIGAEPTLDAVIGRSQSPQRSPTVTLPQQTARAPAVNVNFETGWSLASNPNWLEDRVEPRVIDIKPGDRLRKPAGILGGPVIITKPGSVKKLPTKKHFQ